MYDPWVMPVLVAAGVFLGNWLVIPFLSRERSVKTGFFTGLVGAAIVLSLFWQRLLTAW